MSTRKAGQDFVPTRREPSRRRLASLHAQISAGIEAIERGEFIELDDIELDAYLQGVAAGTAKREKAVGPTRRKSSKRRVSAD